METKVVQVKGIATVKFIPLRRTNIFILHLPSGRHLSLIQHIHFVYSNTVKSYQTSLEQAKWIE